MKAYYKLTAEGYEVGSKSREGFIEYTVGSEPAELKVLLDTEANEQARLQAKADRDTALNSMTHTLADGSVVQTRPVDAPNFQMAIAIGAPKNWVLADNTVKTGMTVAEMQECLDSGMAQGNVIWDAYTAYLAGE